MERKLKDEPCAICGDKSDHTHHIVYRSKWPEGANVGANLMRVCAPCHMAIHYKYVDVPLHLWNAAQSAHELWYEQTHFQTPLPENLTARQEFKTTAYQMTAEEAQEKLKALREKRKAQWREYMRKKRAKK